MRRTNLYLLVIVACVALIARVVRHGGGSQLSLALSVVFTLIAVLTLVGVVIALRNRARGAGGLGGAFTEWTEERIAQMQEQWERQRDEKRQARADRKAQRKLKDRRNFGDELWGVGEEHLAATTNEVRLRRFSLPDIASEQQLADLLGISLHRLRWFTHHKPADTVCHYVRHTLPKRSGGERVIMAPKRELKALQRKLLARVLNLVPTGEACHGFVKDRSVVTNATGHVGKAVVLNLDLKDFFPTVTYPRVRGIFVSLGYAFPVASALALLCTECEREQFDRDGTRYHVAIGPRALIQGAPTSPALANLACWRMDKRLTGLATKHGFTYTRYADDLTFSGDAAEGALRILGSARRIIRDEGFEVNPAKTRLYRRSSRQVVTGLVVNDQVSTPRALRRRLRAILHNAAQSGLESQNQAGHPDFRAHLAGQIAHVQNANPEQAAALRDSLAALE